MITDADIRRIYNEHIRIHNCSDYLDRYVPLPLDRNTGRWRWEGKDFPRVICVLEFERLIWDYDISCDRLLIINGGGDDPEADCLDPGYTLTIDYNAETGENDLHKLDLPEKDFDLILLGQTLEHLYDPILALFGLYQHLAPGGCLFTSAPVVNISHSTPHHFYTGFTPVGLGCMCYTNGFDIIHIGQWGNTRYVHSLFETRAWPDYVHLGHDIHNEFNCPVSAWILAQRPWK